jgi:hypothetical protein
MAEHDIPKVIARGRLRAGENLAMHGAGQRSTSAYAMGYPRQARVCAAHVLPSR